MVNSTHPRRLALADLPTIQDFEGMASRSGLQQLLRFCANARSIAVAGSSGTLLRSGLGADIDAHDVVLRVNDAITAGYEHDCGIARPHLRVGWKVGLEAAAQHNQLCCGTLALITSQLPSATPAQSISHASGVPLTTTFLQRGHELLGDAGDWPSTGWFAIAIGVALARHLRARVSVYGFGRCVSCNKYYDCDGSNATDLGGIEDELTGHNGARRVEMRVLAAALAFCGPEKPGLREVAAHRALMSAAICTAHRLPSLQDGGRGAARVGGARLYRAARARLPGREMLGALRVVKRHSGGPMSVRTLGWRPRLTLAPSPKVPCTAPAYSA